MVIGLLPVNNSDTTGCIKLKLFASSLQSIWQQFSNRKPIGLENILVNRVVYDPEYHCDWQNRIKPNQERLEHSRFGDF